MLIDMVHNRMISVCVYVCVWDCVKARHIKLSRPALHLPSALGQAGSYPVLHERTPWTGSELVPSLGASLGPNPASPLIRGGAQAPA